MRIDDNFFDFDSNEAESPAYPYYYFAWDKILSEGKKPELIAPEEIKDIIEIYLEEGSFDKARKTIYYALNGGLEEDEDFLYEVFVLLSDFEQWNDTLSLCDRYKHLSEFWIDGHRLEALLHLGMEDEAFQVFGEIKKTYAEDKESLSVLYRAMGEALIEVDLFEAVVLVIGEAIDLLGKDIEFYWLQIDSYIALDQKEKVMEIAEIISSLAPFDSPSWYRLGICYRNIEEYEKAIDAFEFARNLHFEDEENNLLELIKAYEKNGNLSKALEKAKEFLYLYPDNYYVNLLAANLCGDMEQWEDAINFLNKVIKKKPKMDALYLYKSIYLVNLGEYKKAKQILQEGIDISSDPTGELASKLQVLNEQFPG